MITPLIGGAFILTNTHSDASEAATVKVPYLVIAAIFVAVAVMIYWTPLPEIHAGENPRISFSQDCETRTPDPRRDRSVCLCRCAGGSG